MNVLEKVRIEGFWGDKNIDIKFYRDVNFFIGVNGSGKTTVINLIAATLSADFPTLDRIEFNLIKIELSEVGGRRKPVIEVEKTQSEDSPYPNITYRIKEKSSDKFKTYSLDEFEEESLLRRQIPARHYHMYMRKMNRGILARLKSLTNVSWLSIHRASSPDRSSDEESYESSVDQKLNELSNSLARYFSVLSSKVSEEIADFQRSIIVSLLTEQEESAVFSSVKKLDLEEEKKSLTDIFSKLNISATTKLDKHFRQAGKALKKLNDTEALDLTELMFLVSSYRSHRVVQDWNRLLEKQAEILKPKNTFVDVLNGLFQRKKVHINDKNEIEVITQSGKHFSIRGLSSGEKQLIIILGEALLQQSSPWVYIADEPELSLHVKWQESLISNLRRLNSSSQILCATHSPDVVSSFSRNVFDMEGEIK
jgi:predicted ATP-binding protein involved in virulence